MKHYSSTNNGLITEDVWDIRSKFLGRGDREKEREDVPDWELILFLQKRSLECIARSPSILQLPTLLLEGMDGEAVIISSICQCYNSACDYVL